MKTISFFALLAIILCSCERKPFVNHKVKLEQKGNCDQAQASFRMVSNFGGERYEFDKCLPADYSSGNVVSERKGDTVVVRFPRAGSGTTAAFAVTLDIDSYPRYQFLTIDEDTYTIVPSVNK